MAKAPAADQESPADRVKRELAEREQREKEALAAAEQQKTADKLTPEEEAALAASEQQDDLRAKLAAAEARIAKMEADKPAEEDPAIVAERAERFRRAEEFEKRMAASRQRVVTSAPPSSLTADEVAQDGMTTVTMPIAAFDVIHRLALALPLSTPPEHVMCGYGGIKVTVGLIRAMAGVKMR